MSSTSSVIEVIPDVLHFACGWTPGSGTRSSVSISADADLQYTAFFADFGPLNLGLTVRFCQRLDRLLLQAEQRPDSRAKADGGGDSAGPVVCYCTDHPHRRANTAVLLCAYLIIFRGMSLEDAYTPFFDISPPLIAFRDAAFGINTFGLTVLDCARAIHRAVVAGHFRIDSFSVEEYERLSRLEHGDISWIVPGKFIAFSGPLSNRRELSPGVFTLLPQEYVKLFQRLGVTCVIRFNNKCYDRKVFTRAGIRHVDLFYEDGGNPTDAILQICEQETGAVAVHCKAGLGRTGTNIAAYLIKHYGYSARESIAWCRICRPGSVVGPQQQYLIGMEGRLRAAAPSNALARGGRDSGATTYEKSTMISTVSSNCRSSKDLDNLSLGIRKCSFPSDVSASNEANSVSRPSSSAAARSASLETKPRPATSSGLPRPLPSGSARRSAGP